LIAVSFCFLYPGLLMKSWRFKVSHPESIGELADISMSTFDLIKALWTPERVTILTVSAGLVFTVFSVVVPHIKLALIWHSLFARSYPTSRENEYIDFRRLVRRIGKFQLIDIYFITIMAATLPNAVIGFEIRAGSVWLLLFCILSILGAMLLDRNPYRVDTFVKPSGKRLALVLLGAAIFCVFLVVAMATPVVQLRYVYGNRVTIAKTDLSLLDIFKELNFAEHGWIAILSFITVVFLPVFRLGRSLHAFSRGGDFDGEFGDFAHLNVYGISLFTVFLVVNSMKFIFPESLAILHPELSVTWGLFSALLAGFFFGEISKKISPPVLTPLQGGKESQTGEFQLKMATRFSQSLRIPFSIVKIIVGLILFLLWFFQQVEPPIKLADVNSQLRADMRFFSGKFENWVKKKFPGGVKNPTGAPLLKLCFGFDPPAIFRAASATLRRRPSGVLWGKIFVEVSCAGPRILKAEIREIRGLEKLEFSDLEISHVEGRAILRISGFLPEFSAAVDLTGLWGGTGRIFHQNHTVKNVHADLTVASDLQNQYPFISQVNVTDFKVNSPVQAELPFGQFLPGALRSALPAHLRDMVFFVDGFQGLLPEGFRFASRIDRNRHVLEGMRLMFQMLLNATDPWIPMGDVKFTTEDFANHILMMNTPGDSGSFRFQ